VRYAAQGRVEVLDSGTGWVTGEVQGGHYEPYVVDVEWFDGPRGQVVSDECSCPLGGRCKHAVALIITSSRSNGAAQRATGGSPEPPKVDWRQALAKVAVAE